MIIINSCTNSNRSDESDFLISVTVQELNNIINNDTNYKIVYIYDPYCEPCIYNFHKIYDKLINDYNENMSYYFITKRNIAWKFPDSTINDFIYYKNVFLYTIKDTNNMYSYDNEEGFINLVKCIVRDSSLVIKDEIPQLFIFSKDNIILKSSRYEDGVKIIEPYHYYDVTYESLLLTDFNQILERND